jgi:NAD(P)-dependent dehydrogenase (short-subunit alcohol dehydrogenase family)
MTSGSYSPPRTSSEMTAIVAGAASGIGRSIAGRLAGSGASVAMADLNEAGLAQAAAELEQQGFTVMAVPTDTGQPEAVARLVKDALRRFGSVDVTVNCVGITGESGKRSHEIPLDDFDTVVAVNLRAAFVLSQAVLPVMLNQRYGRLLHVASIAGKEGNAGMVSYSATKAGLIGMVKAMGKEYAADGVTVNALAPAVIWTPLVEAMPEAQVKYMTDRIPMGRLGTLDEVAAMAQFIVSPDASFCTGFTFDLSGGRATY